MNLFIKDTHYRNRFETNSSSGSMDIAARKSWEEAMFDQKYAKAKN
jgi:hypothetical protein